MATKKPSLKLGAASPSDAGAPPSNLGASGAKLWKAVMSEYDLSDSGGLALLQQACEAADRLEALAEHIKNDGAIVHTRNGPKEHPLLRAEMAARGFTVRTLSRLGLDVEPIRSSVGVRRGCADDGEAHAYSAGPQAARDA